MEITNEVSYEYYMVHGGLKQIRTNIEMNIPTRIQKKSAKVQHKNIASETDCFNNSWKDLITDINDVLKKDDLELEHYNVDK